MARRLSRRQRLKRDPLNQRPPRLRAWAERHGFGPAARGKQLPPEEPRFETTRAGTIWRDIHFFFKWRKTRA